jgi:hypothetical protein
LIQSKFVVGLLHSEPLFELDHIDDAAAMDTVADPAGHVRHEMTDCHLGGHGHGLLAFMPIVTLSNLFTSAALATLF